MSSLTQLLVNGCQASILPMTKACQKVNKMFVLYGSLFVVIRRRIQHTRARSNPLATSICQLENLDCASALNLVALATRTPSTET